jgi:anti-sigma factor RsiW
MNQELGLKLQAYLDGELSAAEAREVSALIESDADARSLYTELQQISVALTGSEIERRLPESREFFWSKIEREIQRLDAEPAPSAPWWLAFARRHMAAVSGFGVATALLMVAAFQMNVVPTPMMEEIDNPIGASTLSFRVESAKTTLVWISDEAAPDEVSDTASEETVQ